MFVKYGIYTLLFLLICIGGPQHASALDVTVTARVHGCGDNILDSDEQCDGNPVTHNSCTNLGFTSGTLSCTNACNYDTSSCSVEAKTSTSPSSAGFSVINFFKDTRNKISDNLLSLRLPKNSVIFEGDAEPGSEVILSDGASVLAKTTSDTEGRYLISVSNISTKNNIFTLTNDTEKRTFIVNMYSNNIVKYNDVSLKNVIKTKIYSIISEYENKWKVNLSDNQTRVF